MVALPTSTYRESGCNFSLVALGNVAQPGAQPRSLWSLDAAR